MLDEGEIITIIKRGEIEKMGNFGKFKKVLTAGFNSMAKSQLFEVDLDKDALYSLYLESFPAGSNEIYKERRKHDCQTCKNFIRRAGNIVTINKDFQIVSIWDIKVGEPYTQVVAALSAYVKQRAIARPFLSVEPRAGSDFTLQELEDGTVHRWNHLFTEYPSSYVVSIDAMGALKSKSESDYQVFERSMRELTFNAGVTVLGLIDQGSIYRGEEHKTNVVSFIKEKRIYDGLSASQQANWCWTKAGKSPVTRVRNTALGTLLIDISANIPLDEAVAKFEKVMAPANYKRPIALFTKKMVEDAEAKISELGYEDSLGRRFATLEDITVNNVLFVSRDAKKVMGVFDELKNEAIINPKLQFKKVEEVSIDQFVSGILPHASSVELMVENKHQANLMSLIAPIKESKSMFQWDNNFSWAYNGDIADSDVRANVKSAGGKVDGVLRFSIQWNDGDNNQNDFDAHCEEPRGNTIYFNNKINPRTGGNLDIDITRPGNKVAVENITWPVESKMGEGIYKFYVHNYSHNGGTTGFTAEIEYKGEIHKFVYDKEIRNAKKVLVAEIKYTKVDGIKFIKSLDSTTSSREIWGVNTNNFVKVSSLMMSPNYWDDQKGKGNRHFFFMLENCINDGNPRGFFNEYLNTQLTANRKVFEALGSKMRVAESDTQLSGLGFSSTQRNSVVVKVTGNVSRVVKVLF